MIIELFGPPASGKTTFATALAASFKEGGSDPSMVSSARPAERNTQSDTAFLAPLRRVSKIGSVLPSLFSGDALGSRLLELMPPDSFVWSIRLKRYLAMLDRSWTKAMLSKAITIVDQGYLSALTSLALLSTSHRPDHLSRGLALLPKPDLLVCLSVPTHLLRSRLEARLRAQSAFERLFELDLATNLRQADIVATVTALLRQQNRPMIVAQCASRQELMQSVGEVTTAIDTLIEADREERRA